MIHHLSIPARDPLHVTRVLLELFEGVPTRFGPYRDSYIVWLGDAWGSAIEVFPAGTEMFPDRGAGQANFRHNAEASPFGAVHAAVSIARDRETIFAVAEREGWRAIELPRGGFSVIEFWIENAFMMELLTPDMAADYLNATAPFRKPPAP